MYNFSREHLQVQNDLVDLYARRRASEAERAKRGRAPLPRPPAAPLATTPRPAPAPAPVVPTVADLEFERVRAAALARIAAERAEAAEVDKAVAAILEARDLAAGRTSAPVDSDIMAIVNATRPATTR